VEETKNQDVEMIETSTAATKKQASFKEKSWDALCSIQQEISGSSEAEV